MATAEIQYDFWTPKPSEMELVKADLMSEIEKISKSGHAVRRGTYASISEIRKENRELKERLDILERFICRGDNAK